MNIYVLFGLTMLLTLLLCGVSLLVAIWIAGKYGAPLVAAIIHALASILAATGVPLGAWYLTSRVLGIVSDHGIIMVLPFFALAILACGVLSAAKGADWIARSTRSNHVA